MVGGVCEVKDRIRIRRPSFVFLSKIKESGVKNSKILNIGRRSLLRGKIGRKEKERMI